jgi:prevent-host-death family protein
LEVVVTVMMNMMEAKTNLSKLVELAVRGEEVVIANRGVPMVKLEPAQEPGKRKLGFLPGNLPESFFDPLPDEELEAWGL